ncbi:MAG: hypothetical protein DMD56_10740 [Gemmatimonadetes bacterium]|nr:MAG: hypothetical protein DMD56_10740 [Gemmatimonadota bacterium]
MVSRSNSPRLIALLAWLVAASVPLAAQTPAPITPLRLSFADAVRLASGEVPVVALATLRTDEADARVRQARAALLPSVSVGGFWLNRSFNSRSIGISFPGIPELIGPFNNYDARFSATQTLFDWSSVRRVRAAGAQADGSRAERGVTVEGSVLTAAVAYVRAVRAQAVVAARQADSAIAAELVGLAEAQRAAGVSPAIDVTRARAQLATAQGLLLVAQNQLDRGRIDVTRALGLDPATPLTLTDSLAPSLGAADVPVQRDSSIAAALASAWTSRMRWYASRRCARPTCAARSRPKWTPPCSIWPPPRRNRRWPASSCGSPRASSASRVSASRPALPATST